MPKAKKQKRLWARFFGRTGDQRSVLGKELQSYLVDAEHSPEMLSHIIKLRGDLRGKWRDRAVSCLYCGLQATEEDHYKSAVKHKLIAPYLDCPLNRVPSCAKCHRGGKDHPVHADKSVLEWFNMKTKLSKNHPKNVMQRAQCSDAHIARVRSRLERFDAFHRRFAPRMSPPHLEAVQNFVERVLLFRNAVFKSVSSSENQLIFQTQNYVQASNELFLQSPPDHFVFEAPLHPPPVLQAPLHPPPVLQPPLPVPSCPLPVLNAHATPHEPPTCRPLVGEAVPNTLIASVTEPAPHIVLVSARC